MFRIQVPGASHLDDRDGEGISTGEIQCGGGDRHLHIHLFGPVHVYVINRIALSQLQQLGCGEVLGAEDALGDLQVVPQG